jgi:hypothetical protein
MTLSPSLALRRILDTCRPDLDHGSGRLSIINSISKGVDQRLPVVRTILALAVDE